MGVFWRGLFLFLVLMVVATLLAPANAQTAGQYDPVTEGIASDYYPVDREQGFITGIAPGTPVHKVLSTCAPSGLTASGETVTTGMTLTYGEGQEAVSLTAIVTGDLNGDGAVSITDMLMIKSYLLGQELTAAASAAGDLNNDGNVSITDFLKVKSYLLGMETIGGPPSAENLELLIPGQSLLWQVESAEGYRSGDPQVLTVHEDGTVTAGQEGTAYVYALDQDGNVMDRKLITVLDEPLALTVNTQRVRLPLGQTHTLKTQFNHPVEAQVYWFSSDENVVTVEDGVLTAVLPGEATVTAALDNGSRADVSVTVAPAITDIDIERKLYKVKPGDTKQLQLCMEPADSGEEILWTSSDPAIATVAPDGTVTGVSYGTVTITATGKYSGLSAQCDVKICDVIQVAMTFDDGPSKHTDRLLDFLGENDIRVTFFLVVNRLQKFQGQLLREVEQGHEMGYHSYAHKIQTSLSTEKITSDFIMSDDLLYEMTGQRFTVWRTPGGGYSSRVVAAVELPHILWSVDTLDWKTLNAYKVYSSIIRNAKDGDIILLHDLHGTTVDGAIMAMKEMLEGDYEFLTVTELLSRDGTPPENSQTYYRG